MRAQPGAQQGPRPLHGVDVDLAEAVAILVARVLPAAVADRLVPIAPGRQRGIHPFLGGGGAAPLAPGAPSARRVVLLPHTGQKPTPHPPPPEVRPGGGGLVLPPPPAPGRARQPATASKPPPLAT